MSTGRVRRRRDAVKKRKINGRISRKLLGLFGAVTAVLALLAVRITYINATDGEQYRRQVLSQTQQQYDSRTIPFQRGDIVDRNGTILATSEKVYNLILDCKVVNTATKVKGEEKQLYLEPTVEALVEQLGMDETTVRSLLESEETKNSQYQVLKKQMSITEKKEFEAYLDVDSEENKNLSKEERTKRQRVKGVWFEEDYLRVYPMGSLACDLIGFTYSGNTADWGIEGYYSSVLNGVNGRQFGYLNADAGAEQTIIEPVNGNHVVSTIDMNIQQIIRKALENFQTEMANGPNGTKAAQNIGVIAMDPNTGEILGMDSSDWYDLNDPRNLSAFYTQEQIDAMDEEAQLNALYDLWKNYCITDSFEPGSTVKPMTIAAALECNDILESGTYVCDGYQEVGGQKIRCSVYPNSHGTQTLGETLKNSCNDALMQIGEEMGVDDFLKYQEIFNFGALTGIDLPGEGAGILFTRDSMGETELATSTFGQGFNCTMLQEIAAFCSVINGGTYYKPHVVRSITDSEGNVVENIEPVAVRRTVSQEVSDTIRQYLGTVMEEGGTGAGASVAGYRMGGKTGTAQKLPRGNGKYLVSFIGFAPLDNPEVAVYVVVDEPNAENQASSSYAQKIYKNIMQELMPYLNIFPEDPSAVESVDFGASAAGAQQDGIADANVPAPPEDTQEGTGEGENQNLLSGGITNSDAAMTNQQ